MKGSHKATLPILMTLKLNELKRSLISPLIRYESLECDLPGRKPMNNLVQGMSERNERARAD